MRAGLSCAIGLICAASGSVGPAPMPISDARAGPTTLDEGSSPLSSHGVRCDGIISNGGLEGTDDTVAINRAIAQHVMAVLPSGLCRVTGEIFVPAGHTLAGLDRVATQLVAGPDFAPGAQGVVTLGSDGGTSAGNVQDLGITFVVPDPASRAAVVVRPPAIYGQNAARARISRVRTNNAYDGLDLRGNAGGDYVDDIEVGALHVGIQLDGALDFVHGRGWHFWPFGMSTAVQHRIYGDGDTVAARLGKVDGLSITDLSAFQSSVVLTADAADGLIPYQIGTLILDADYADLLMPAGGLMQVGMLSSVKSGSASKPGPIGPTLPGRYSESARGQIVVGGGARLTIGSLSYTGGPATTPIQVSGAGTEVSIGSGRINCNNTAVSCATVGGGGMLDLGAINADPGSGPWSAPYFSQTDTGVMRAPSVVFHNVGSTGVGLSFATDEIGNFVGHGTSLGSFRLTAPRKTVDGFYERR